MSGTVLVFGGSGGIGQAVASALKARGIGVHLVGRDRARLEAAAQNVGGANFTVADVTDADDIADAVNAAAQKAGGALAGLCYAVGSIRLKPVARLEEEEILADFRLNALGAFTAVKSALPALKAHPGTASVLLFSTVAVKQGFASHASIGLAKGAIEGLTLSLAAELAPKIRVNCIAPSLTRTPLAAPLLANETMANAIAGLHAVPRIGEPGDVGPLAALLLSDEAGWITGQSFSVDGGRSTLRTKG
jgi:NAD(P)-dependent dehydrogenase (short-subunit alcohol dehydrogenase family)